MAHVCNLRFFFVSRALQGGTNLGSSLLTGDVILLRGSSR